MPAPSDLFISEYIEGSSNNKAIEIFNGTGSAITLTGYSLRFFSNGSAAAGLTINLTGTVAAGDVFVVAQASAHAAILAQADQTNGAGWFNGDDAVALFKGETAIDVIGQIGVDPGTEWGSGLVSTADNTLRRKETVSSGDPSGSNAFDPATEWDGFAVDVFGGLGSHTFSGGGSPTISVSASDAHAAEAGSDPGTFRITLSQPAAADLIVPYTLGGSASPGDYTPALPGSVTIPAGSSTADITLTPADDNDVEGPETLTITLGTVSGYAVSGGPATITIADNDTAIRTISAVQGSGASSPLSGQTVTIEAIVVADTQGSPGLQGFYVQEEDADADASTATSEGLFVFQGVGNTTAVQVGDKVRVTGTVTEFNSNGASLTQLGSLSSVQVVSSGNPLPAATPLQFPVQALGDLEALEGMRVMVGGTLTVTDNFDLGRFGELTLAADGPGNVPGTDARLDQFTQFYAPSATGLAAYMALNALRTIVLDDANSAQNPAVHLGRDGQPLSAANTLRGGDTVSNLEGVIDHRFGTYRIQPTAPVDVEPANPRAAVPAVGGTLQVASLNVLNFFNGDGLGGGFPTSRGADSLLEYDRQLPKIVQAILGTGAEVVGLLEIENDGFGPASAIASLVDALNQATAPGTWAFVNPGRGLGADEIAVGMVYQPAVVTPKGAAAVLDSAVDPRFDSGSQRPSLAQTFEVNETGARFTPVINHLKSKGSSAGGIGDADIGDGQGLSNGTRTQAAKALVDWLATDPTGQGDTDYLVLGDLNAYAQEDPIRAIRAGTDDTLGTADDYGNLIPDSSYSYSFDGYWGALDHALGSRSLLAQVTGAGKWHINADEPTVLDYNTEFKSPAQIGSYYAPDAFRSSDHDPVVVGLNLGITLTGTSRGDTLVGTSGADTLRAGQGSDGLLGGAGADRFVYGSLLDFFDIIGDWERGLDRLDITALMAAVGAQGRDPVAGGYLQATPMTPPGLVPGPALTLVTFDPDGIEGPAAGRPMVVLVGVSPVIDAAELLG